MESLHLKDLLRPFKCLDHLLTALYILNKYPNYQLSTLNQLILKFTGILTTNSDITALRERVNAYPLVYGTNFFSKMTTLQDNIQIYLNEIQMIQFATERKTCIFCKSDFSSDVRKNQAACYYFSTPPKSCTINIKQCDSCKSAHYLNYAEMDGVRIFYDTTLSDKFLAFTDESVFEKLLLDSFTADLISKYSSFQGFASSYNSLFNCKRQYKNGSNFNRIYMNEIRFNQAWFFYQFLKVYFEIHQKFPYPAPSMQNLDNAIRYNLKPLLSKYFITKWSGDNT